MKQITKTTLQKQGTRIKTRTGWVGETPSPARCTGLTVKDDLRVLFDVMYGLPAIAILYSAAL